MTCKIVMTSVAAAVACSMGAQGAVIDSFQSVASTNRGSPWPITQFSPGTVQTLEEDLLGVLGGVRTTTVTYQSEVNPDVDFLSTSIGPAPGLMLDYASTGGADGAIELLYDGNGSMHADFTQELAIVVDFGDFNFAFGVPLPVTITLSDGSASASMSQTMMTAGAEVLSFNIAKFAGIGAVNLADITSLAVAIDPGVAVDFRIQAITTVSVPGPGALAMFAVAGGVVLPRRRRC